MSVVAAIREMLAKGMSIEDALQIAEAFETRPEADMRSAGAKRQERFRERKRNAKASQSVTNVTPDDRNESNAKASQSVTNVTAYARVEDNLLTLAISGEEEREGVARAKNRYADNASFERFWIAWPNKVQKPYAQKCFAKVADQIEAIRVGIERYVRLKPPDRPWLNPSTFLNQHRWEDRPAMVSSEGGRNGPRRSLVDAGIELTQRLRAERLERELRARNRVVDGDETVRVLSAITGERS
jgi:hypothetical protein